MNSSSSSSTQLERLPLEVGPLPRKRGEIGYREDLHSDPSQQEVTNDNNEPFPTRHPADTSPSSSPEPVVETPAQSRSVLPFLSRRNKFGVKSSTTLFLIVQSLTILITITLWIVLAMHGPDSAGTKVFVHTSFGAAVLVQLIFLERTVFTFRAERYAVAHPGEMMPGNILHPGLRGLSINPWNRPPLPTYAAVLYESGIATGDVEDVEIAVIPPPAYGVTRGSRFVIAGPISQELADQSRRVRLERGYSLSIHSPASRPVSYISTDLEWETRCDAARAAALQETLTQTEEGHGNPARSSSVSS